MLAGVENESRHARGLVRLRSQDGFQHGVQLSGDVFGQKAQHEVSPFLQGCIFAPVPAVSIEISQVLRAIEFDHQPCGFAENIYFH